MESHNPYLEYVKFAVDMSYQAGKLTLAHFMSDLSPDKKADGSPVTIADRQAEEYIRSQIEKKYPTHEILGEEFGESGSGSSFRWVIDPIDGTKSFIQGVPLYAVLIGLEIEGRVEVGVVNFPALNEMMWAATGLGCWHNGRAARLSGKNHLADSVLTYTNVSTFHKTGRSEVFDRFVKKTRLCAGWGDAYGYLLAASGRTEIAIDPAMNPWDCGPFPPIFRELGAYFGDWQGNETIYGGEAVATSRELLPQVLAVINNRD